MAKKQGVAAAVKIFDVNYAVFGNPPVGFVTASGFAKPKGGGRVFSAVVLTSDNVPIPPQNPPQILFNQDHTWTVVIHTGVLPAGIYVLEVGGADGAIQAADFCRFNVA